MRIDEFNESRQQCPECGGPAFSDLMLAEKQDACYAKVKSRYKVWPSAYASGALVQCRKKGAANWGNKSKNESVAEDRDMCNVCGQTPCNCTHVSETKELSSSMNERTLGQTQPRTAASAAQILSAVDDGKTITVRVRTPDGTTRTIANSNPAVIQQWLNVKYGLKFPANIAKKFVGMPQSMAEESSNENIRVEPVARSLKTQPTQTQPKQNVYVAPEKKTPAVVNHIKQKGVAEDMEMDTVYVIYVDGKPKVRFKDVQQAIDTYTDLKKHFVNSRVEMKKGQHPAHSFSEDYNAEYDDEAGMAQGSLHTLQNAVEGLQQVIDAGDNLPEWCQEKISLAEDYLVTVWDYIQSEKAQGMDPKIQELAEEFDLIESLVNKIADHNGVDAEMIWEDLESLSDDELYVFAVTSEPIMESEAWQKANNRDKTDGMSRKAVKAYRRAHPGSKLQTAVTTKPSKLKKGSKASKRRKSYCSRSRGQMKMHNISCAKTPDKAICKARRRWNC